MKLLALCAAGIGLMLCASCTNNKHLISDEAERAAVQQDFEARRDTLAQGDLFQVFEQPMSDEQKEAMTFLYAYMPLADIADHPGEFYLENVDYAFKAREEMPWGKVINRHPGIRIIPLSIGITYPVIIFQLKRMFCRLRAYRVQTKAKHKQQCCHCAYECLFHLTSFPHETSQFPCLSNTIYIFPLYHQPAYKLRTS